MPYVSTYVLPDVFLKYKGVTVYHTYKEGEFSEPSNNFLCTHVDDADGYDHKTQFDVRELPGFKIKYPPFLTGKDNTPANKKKWDKFRADKVEHKAQLAAVKQAIDNKLLTIIKED